MSQHTTVCLQDAADPGHLDASVGRPDWDSLWMGVARLISLRSVDRRAQGTQVGCVVVTDDNTQVLALGYNGNHRGGPNEPESDEPGQTGLIHAEVNAAIKLNYGDPRRKTLYVTVSPCRMCAKVIVQARIDRVVFERYYRDTSGLDILRDAGIQLMHLT